jgi:hypothetical protein
MAPAAAVLVRLGSAGRLRDCASLNSKDVVGKEWHRPAGNREPARDPDLVALKIPE